jgi:hypothetical protein
MARRPEDRFQTAEEFLENLTAAAVGRVMPGSRPLRTEIGPAPLVRSPQGSARKSAEDWPSLVQPERPPTRERPQQLQQRAPRFAGPGAVTRKRPISPRSFSISISPLAIIALLIIAGAAYYFYFYEDPVLVSADSDPLAGTFSDRESAPDPAADSPSGHLSRSGSPLLNEAPPPSTVTIWLDAVPRNVAVLWDGSPVAERPLVVPYSAEPVQVIFTSPGYEEQRRQVTPDQVQTLKVKLSKVRTGKKRKKKRR